MFSAIQRAGLSAVAVAAVLALAPASVLAKQTGLSGAALQGVSPDSSPMSGPISVYNVDVTGIRSNDPLGSVLNEIRNLSIGGGSRVIGIGWDVTLFADSPSWLSEMAVNFGSSSTGFVNLRPGVADDEPGTQSYSSGGIVDLIGIGLDFTVNADGTLRLEFFETFDDFANDWDGRWERGTLSIQVEGVIPEPSTYALMALGLLGVAAVARRRKA